MCKTIEHKTYLHDKFVQPSRWVYNGSKSITLILHYVHIVFNVRDTYMTLSRKFTSRLLEELENLPVPHWYLPSTRGDWNAA